MINRRFTIIAIWVLLVAACIGVMAGQMQVVTHMAQFMPAAKTEKEKLLLEELNQGRATRLILMAIEADNAADGAALAQLSKDFAAYLRGAEYFAAVNNGQILGKTPRDPLLWRYRYLLTASHGAEPFSVTALRDAFARRLQDLRSPLSVFNKQRLPGDPTDALGQLQNMFTSQQSPQRHYGVWFSPDKRRALLLAETRSGGYDLDTQLQVVSFIKDGFHRLDEAGQYQLWLSGPAVFATESRNRIRSETTLLSLIASGAVLLILSLAYRSAPVLIISALPLATGIVLAATGVQLLFGYVHGITLAFGITVLGVAIDYPIHLFSHLTGEESLSRSLQRIWPTLRLGVITTASGYLAMTATDFTGLAQLGGFAIIGLLGAAATTRWVLPALLPAGYCPVFPVPFAKRQLLLQPGRKALAVSILAGIAALAVVAAYKDTMWENDLAALSPIPKNQLALDRQLRADLGAGEATHALLIKAADEQSVLQRSEALLPVLERLTQENVIEGFDLPSRYLPSIDTQHRRQQALPPSQTLATNVKQALQDLPFKPGQFTPFVQAVADSKQLAPLTYDKIQDTPLGLKVSTMLFPRDDAWLGFIALQGINHAQALDKTIDNLDLPGVFYLNMKTATGELIGGFRDETLARMQWAALLIVAVLAAGVRSVRRLAAALTPVIFAIAADMALLLLMGERLSLFNLVALLLVFGIGVDFGLFFSRRENHLAVRRRTLHALVVCAISTVSVFGILSLSQVPVLADIGLTVWLGVMFCFLFSLSLSQQGKTTSA